MTSKHLRHTPSSSSPPPNHGSKLPKFLQKQAIRDRSKSVADPTASTSTLASNSSSAGTPPETPAVTKPPRKGSKLLGAKEPSSPPSSSYPADTLSSPSGDDTMDGPPVIIEPHTPRTRTRSERPLSSASDIHPSASMYSSTSTTRIGDLPSRLSGWFSHTFSSSSTDLSLPSLLSQSHLSSTSSPKGKGASALLNVAKHGKGHLDKAVRYLLDSDTMPDKCTDPIWLLGVQHPGYEPPPPLPPPSSMIRRSSIGSKRHASPASLRSSASSNTAVDQSLSQSQPSSSKHPGNSWPPVFYADFTSRIWLTYRSQFAPIRDTSLAALESEGDASGLPAVSSSPVSKRWNWSGGEKGWSSDSGWGCMLRTGQSLLANALLHLQLGRDWRRPPYPVHTADYATYVQIVTWFLDTPSPLAPFSVHRMALAGKEQGTDVGQWFGPSTAAGAIKTLVHAFPEAGLGVSVASDGTLFQSDVFSESHRNIESPRRHARSRWGERAVLVLVGIRLGLDGVNPIYYDTIKALYTFPQSVGIAGGRPSSSYYFVGSQADNLFYLDPHHARPAIPLQPPPAFNGGHWERETTPESDRMKKQPNQRSNSNHQRVQTSPSSTRTGSSTFSYHAPLSPSPLQQQLSTSSGISSSSSQQHAPSHPRWQTSSQPDSPTAGSEMDHREFGLGLGSVSAVSASGTLDPVQEHYATAYSAAELKTFHCDRVRKMPLSGLDPSMLIGFLCKDEADWSDFRKRVGDLSRDHKTIFSVQDEPPNWPSDSDDNMGLESISEPDDLDMLGEPADGEADAFFETRSRSASPASATGPADEYERGKSEEPEEDGASPGSSKPLDDDVQNGQGDEAEAKDGFEGDGFDDDIEDDWIDPSVPMGRPQPHAEPETPVPVEFPTLPKSNGSQPEKARKAKKALPQVPIPVPTVNNVSLATHYGPAAQSQQQHYPFPRSAEDPAENVARTAGKRNGGMRMHTTRARDGGRTHSGGVKGILPDEL